MFVAGTEVSSMDYRKTIVSLLEKLNNEQLKCVYLFIKGILD